MREVVITGIGQVPAGEHWDVSLRSLAARAILAAQHEVPSLKPQALYVGNLLGSVLSHQANLGALLVDNTGLGGIEASAVESGGASGGAALRLGYLAVASGFVDTVIVVGVEKMTDKIGPGVEAALAESSDADYEAIQGLTLAGQAGLVMQRYLHQYGVERGAFAGFAMLAHANAVANPNAFFRKAIRAEAYHKAEEVASPLNMYDIAPAVDGAAALILTTPEHVPADFGYQPVRITGSSMVVDRLALHDRPDPLAFDAARLSVERACRMAGILPGDADFFELTDSFSIYAALALEAAGFAARGQAPRMVSAGQFDLKSEIPINTLGGMKGRGYPVGAAGVYQAVDAVTQLRGTAGAGQVAGARRALIQSLGGPASSAAVHVLEA